MKMPCFLLFTGVIALVVALSPAASAADRSPEMAVLDRFLGTWDHVITITPTGGEASRHQTVSRRSWSHGKSYLRFEEVNEAEPEYDEFQMLLTHDADEDQYTGVIMDGNRRSTVTGTWDESTASMRLDALHENGNRLSYTIRFIDADRAEAEGIFSDAEGNAMVSIRWEHIKRGE